MLQYKSEYLRDPYIKDLKYSLYACYKYEIFDASENISSVYASQSMTLVYCSDMQLRVERTRRLFAKPHHFIYNNKNGEQLGVFEFPNWQSAAKTRCILRLNAGQVYSFIQNNDHRRLLKPATWGRYCFEMTNSEHWITYDGNRKTGSITSADETDIMSIALGFFIIDDKFRTSEETAG
jgi:hypothetical protein